MTRFSCVLIIVSVAAVLGCTKNLPELDSISENGVGIRPLTQTERNEDFEILVSSFREFYGPLKFKEKRFGFDFEQLVKESRAEVAAATSDDEMYGAFKRFITHFHDGHVSLSPGPQKISSFTVPIALTSVEGRIFIGSFFNETVAGETGFSIGDEVTAIDGKAPSDYLPTILKYDSMGNDLTDKQLILRALRRPSYISELKPTSPTVRLTAKNAAGVVFEKTLIWNVRSDDYVNRAVVGLAALENAYSPEAADIAKATLLQMGDAAPFFATPAVETALELIRVKPSDKFLSKYGLTDAKKVPDLYAALYRFEGKNLLLVRQPTYEVQDPSERIAWFKAVLDEYGKLADALVLDQTHNPGGSISYADDFVSIFSHQDTRGLVNFLHPDRRWLSAFQAMDDSSSSSPEIKNIAELGYKLVEEAYDQGLPLTKFPIGLMRSDYIRPAKDFVFGKPVLLLIDEIAGSCGDMVPAMFKANKLATLFGTRTMGLGGNVETVARLPHSQAELNLTRGMTAIYSATGVYDLDHPIENNGVDPDIPYAITASDFRSGYVDYVRAFSHAAATLH
jgi:C-terminal processing protease CtpA/Prc